MSENDIIAEYVKAKYPDILRTVDFFGYKLQAGWHEVVEPAEKALKKLADTLAKVGKQYPSWNMLTDEQKQIVNSIAMQIPVSCENVATIFISHGQDRQKTIDCIRELYGYVVD